MKHARDYVVNMVQAMHHLDVTEPSRNTLDQARVPELLSFMGDHDPELLDPRTVMQILFESALKTQHSKDAEKANLKEISNLIWDMDLPEISRRSRAVCPLKIPPVSDVTRGTPAGTSLVGRVD